MIEVVTTCEKCEDVLKSPPNHVGDTNFWLNSPSRPKGWVYYHIENQDTMGAAVGGRSVLVCPDCSEKFLQTFESWTPPNPKSKKGKEV